MLDNRCGHGKLGNQPRADQKEKNKGQRNAPNKREEDKGNGKCQVSPDNEDDRPHFPRKGGNEYRSKKCPQPRGCIQVAQAHGTQMERFR